MVRRGEGERVGLHIGRTFRIWVVQISLCRLKSGTFKLNIVKIQFLVLFAFLICKNYLFNSLFKELLNATGQKQGVMSNKRLCFCVCHPPSITGLDSVLNLISFTFISVHFIPFIQCLHFNSNLI